MKNEGKGFHVALEIDFLGERLEASCIGPTMHWARTAMDGPVGEDGANNAGVHGHQPLFFQVEKGEGLVGCVAGSTGAPNGWKVAK